MGGEHEHENGGMSNLQNYIEWTQTLPYFKKWGNCRMQVEAMGKDFRTQCHHSYSDGRRTRYHGRICTFPTLPDAMLWGEGWLRHHGHASEAEEVRAARLRMNNGQDTLYVFEMHPFRTVHETTSKRHAAPVITNCPVCKRRFEEKEIKLMECLGCGWPSEATMQQHDADMRLKHSFERMAAHFSPITK